MIRQREVLFLILSISLIFLCLGCGDKQIVLRCIDEKTNPIKGVKLEVGGKELGHTDSYGELKIKSKSLPKIGSIQVSKGIEYESKLVSLPISSSPYIIELKKTLVSVKLNINFIEVTKDRKEMGPLSNVDVTVNTDPPVEKRIFGSSGHIEFFAPQSMSMIAFSVQKPDYEVYGGVPTLILDKGKADHNLTVYLVKASTKPVILKINLTEVTKEKGKEVGALSNVDVTVNTDPPTGKRVFKRISGSSESIEFFVPQSISRITLSADKPDYKVYGEIPSLELVEGKTEYSVPIRMYMEKVWRFEFTALISSNPPISVSGVKISIKSGNKELGSAETDAKGSASIQVSHNPWSKVTIEAKHTIFKTQLSEGNSYPLDPGILTRKVSVKVPTVNMNLSFKDTNTRQIIREEFQVKVKDQDLIPTAVAKNGFLQLTIPEIISNQVKIEASPRDSNSEYNSLFPEYTVDLNKTNADLLFTRIPMSIKIDIIAIRRGTKAPIEGVKIFIDNSQSAITTGADGKASYQARKRRGDKIDIEIGKEGYKFEYSPKKLVVSSQTDYDISAIGTPETVKIKAQIGEGTSSLPLTDADVLISGRSVARTDSQGIFEKPIDELGADSKEEAMKKVQIRIEGYEFIHSARSTSPSFDRIDVFRKIPLVTVLCKEQDGTPVGNVKVSLDGRSVNTDPTGKALITLPSSKPRLYNIKLSNYPPHLEESVTINVTDGKDVHVERYLLDIRPPKYSVGIGDIDIDASISGDVSQIKSRIRQYLSDSLKQIGLEGKGLSSTIRSDQLKSGWDPKKLSVDFIVLSSFYKKENFKLEIELYGYAGEYQASYRELMSIDSASLPQEIRRGIVNDISRSIPVRGYITTVSGQSAIINIGSEHFIKSGDIVKVEHIRRDNNGKTIDSEKLKTEFKVESVKGSEASINIPAGITISPGDYVFRPLDGNGNPPIEISLVDKDTGTSIQGARVYHRTSDETGWTFAGNADNKGKVKLKLPRNKTIYILVASREYEDYEKTSPVKNGETWRIPRIWYNLKVICVDPPNSILKISGANLDLPSARTEALWKISPGVYTIQISPPEGEEGYAKLEDSGSIPPRKTGSGWKKAEKIEFSANIIEITFKLHIDPIKAMNEAVKRGDYEKAVDIAKSLKTSDPDYREAIFKAGEISLENLKRPDQAEEMFEDVLKQDHKDPVAHFNLGLCREKLNRKQEAIASYNEALKFIERVEEEGYYPLAHDIYYRLVMVNYDPKSPDPTEIRIAWKEYSDFCERNRSKLSNRVPNFQSLYNEAKAIYERFGK